MKPLNLNNTRRASISHLKASEAVARFTQACKGTPLRYESVDLDHIRNKTQLLDAFAESLNFPNYFGHNWDALYDVLCDEDWFGDTGIILHLKQVTSFEKLAANDWLILCETLEEAIDYWRALEIPFWVFADHTR